MAVQVNWPVPVPQKGPLALMLPWGNGVMVTAKEREGPEQPGFEGVTCTLPEVVPTVTTIELVVPPLF